MENVSPKQNVFVKNSSEDINFGAYHSEIVIRTDGGRLYFSKKYTAKIECDEKRNILKVIVEDPK